MTFTTQSAAKTSQRPVLCVTIFNPDGVKKDVNHSLEDGYTHIEATYHYESPQSLLTSTRLASLKIWTPSGYSFCYMFVGSYISEDTIEFLGSTINSITNAFANRQTDYIAISHHGIKTLIEVTPPQIQGE